MKTQTVIILSTIFCISSSLGENSIVAEFPDPAWRYTTEEPSGDWQKPDFDDSAWSKGHGGFGEPGTPGARVSTKWLTKDIWLRRAVELPVNTVNPALYVYHDEDADVYLNGKRVATFDGYTAEYVTASLNPADVKVGKNLLAVHCRQTTGGQAIDVHLIDAENIPKLPAAERPQTPFKSDLITEWGAKVTAENVWQEYPRPQLVRDNWKNLNGYWDYAISSKDGGLPSDWDGRILVPFSVESKLSGVQRLLHSDKALWYRRSLEAKARPGKRTILNIEACDYRTKVWINNTEVGVHTGGNTPFGFDITNALLDSGQNQLVVRVEDSTDEGYQLRGKQIRNPHGIWYTQVSGIWGTVWTEEVPEEHIEHLTIGTAIDGTITIKLEGTNTAATVRVSLGGKEINTASGKGTVSIKVPDPKLWSPESPTLYDLQITAGEDRVTSYTGIREVGRMKDADGHWRFTLNGERIFHWGPLDQGWWPDGLLTPPSEDAMRWDVDYLKAAGFNMIRKHIKVEPRSYYAYCDRVGMMVWQDQVSGGPSPRWTFIAPNPEAGDWPDEHHEQWMLEYERMISRLESHPSITVWVPFNEAWGQHRTVEVGTWTENRDPSRLTNVASGGNFWEAGHIVDMHAYPHPRFPFEHNVGGRFDDYIKVIGEFGGHGLPAEGHIWDSSARNWGYGGLPKDVAEYKERYKKSIDLLIALKEQGIDGGVYTQTTDVEGEINGLISYDRKVIKIPAAELEKLHAPLLK